MSGKKFRMKRFRYPNSKRGIIVPIDHGLTVGPLQGLESIHEIRQWITHPSICGVITHKGMAERLIEADALGGVGLMIHLNGMSSIGASPDNKERLTSLESALRLGADAVSFQVNFDGHNDSQNLIQMGQVVDEAAKLGVPVLAMIYDKVKASADQSVQRLRHLIRIGIELGCDAVKIGFPEDNRQLAPLLSGLSQDIPIYMAGGTSVSEEDFLQKVQVALRTGAAGLCAGRNIFQKSNSNGLLESLHQMLVPSYSGITELEPMNFRDSRVRYGTH